MNIRQRIVEAEEEPFVLAATKLQKQRLKLSNCEHLISAKQDRMLELYQQYIKKEFKQYSFSMRIEICEDVSRFFLTLNYDRPEKYWREYKTFTLEGILHHNIIYANDSTMVLIKTKEIITDLIDISNSIINEKYHPCVSDTVQCEPWIDIYFTNKEN